MAAERRPTLSVCVIGQNVAGRIEPLLRQAEALADEIVFVDGGSTDDTEAVVSRFERAVVLHRAFDGNFARQKNFAFRHATSDWILLLDADELLGPNLVRLLPRLLRSRFHGFRVPRYWLSQEDPPVYVAAEKLYPDRQLRLFRNRPEFRYDEDRPVHVAIPLERCGPILNLKHSHILHYCFLWEDRAVREQKIERYTVSHPSPINSVYLYEDLPHTLRACREAWRGDRPVGGGLRDYFVDRIRLWVKQPPI